MSAASERDWLTETICQGTHHFHPEGGCLLSRHAADAILAAGFTRQSRAEIQAEAVEGAVKYAATDEHVGMTRDEAIGYEAALDLFRDYAQRIREGGDRG